MSKSYSVDERMKNRASNVTKDGSLKMTKDGINRDEYYGTHIFNFQNGDVYAGHFKATVKEEIFRHGYGKYFCSDGSIYAGTWHEDKLIEAKYLTFNDGDIYEGPLQNFQFSGTGNYNMAKVGNMKMAFIDNCPSGEILLTDPYGFNWQGRSTDDYNETILFPANHFKDTAQFGETYLIKGQSLDKLEEENIHEKEKDQ